LKRLRKEKDKRRLRKLLKLQELPKKKLNKKKGSAKLERKRKPRKKLPKRLLRLSDSKKEQERKE